jgi:E1A/CREB-binding protein
MSDRASTEKTFNNLLNAYRQECLPNVIDNYEKMSTEQQELCGNINNFFCGLHLLVGMADICESSILKFEKNHTTDDIGSATDLRLKRYHKYESGILRLLRTCSKVCAVGEDEKSGASMPWKTYLGSKDQKNLIMRFRHNRFNMLFVVGGAVFFHAPDIQNFLDNIYGTSNDLLKAVALDIKEGLYLAGAKALGLVSKFVSSPLWRLIEAPGHILDMNIHFKTLVDFLDEASNDCLKIGQFITGISTPLNSETTDSDKVLQALIADHKLDEIVIPMLQQMFLAMQQLFRRMIAEHLPGGKFWEPSDQLTEETKSVKKHNKMPEFVFGQLDHLIDFRPNASLLANEAFVMFSFNKTAKW